MQAQGDKTIGIEIAWHDARSTKTVDQVIKALNANSESPVTAEKNKVLARDGESWAIRVIAKATGPEGGKIRLTEEGGKIDFTTNFCDPWTEMGSGPPTTHLAIATQEYESDKRKIPAGYVKMPGSTKFQYGWCGGALGISYGMLDYADRTGDQAERQRAIESIQFFVHNAGTGTPGLYYGDYMEDRGWVPTREFEGGNVPGISSRQYGENLEHLASLMELGRRLKLPEADEWFAALKNGGDFLLRSPRHRGLFPRAWKPDGSALGWPASGTPPPGTVSAAGVQCVCVLAHLATFTGEEKYRNAECHGHGCLLAGIRREPCHASLGSHSRCWSRRQRGGLGHDARTALDTYTATKEPRFLKMAKDAADWTLTWMYFHDVGMKPESGLLHKHLHTVGWTVISTQNQEIDVWGYFMAPDYYRLGLTSGEERYKQIGCVLYQAASQTISRPDAMFGPTPGIQAEHYNHSNCTYHRGQPANWRGSQHSMGIGWTNAGALYGGTRLSELAPELTKK